MASHEQPEDRRTDARITDWSERFAERLCCRLPQLSAGELSALVSDWQLEAGSIEPEEAAEIAAMRYLGPVKLPRRHRRPRSDGT